MADNVARGLALRAQATADAASGGGVINATYAELVGAIGRSELVAGAKYRITDFATTHYIVDAEDNKYPSATPIIVGTTEPLIVLAISVDTISHEATSALYPQDIIHYDWNPANWMDDLSFADAESEPATAIITGFKGVIYFRHDTIQDNYCGYDFRNVKFRRWKTDALPWNAETTYAQGDKCTSGEFIYYSAIDDNLNNDVSTNSWIAVIDISYTEYWFYVPQEDSEFSDLYTFNNCGNSSYETTCLANHIDGYKDTNTEHLLVGTILSNNVFHLNKSYGLTYGNNIKSLSAANTIGAWCYENTINHEFSYNIIDSGFLGNNILGGFSYNIIGQSFSENIINGFSDNIIGTSFANNNIGGGFTTNIISSYFGGNKIGDSFGSNIIKGGFSYNNISGLFNYNISEGSVDFCTIGFNFENNTINVMRSVLVEDGFNFGTGRDGVDFTLATHILGSYNTTLFINSANVQKLRYFDETNTMIVVAANA